MKLEIRVTEVVSIFKEIQEQPDKIFKMIRVELRENVGEYLCMMFLGGVSTRILSMMSERLKSNLDRGGHRSVKSYSSVH